MKKNNRKQEIIKAGTSLISYNGYNATGIDSILKKASVPKGSFYHYFQNKENFGLAVIDKFASDYNNMLDKFFSDINFTPLNRIRNYLEHIIEYLTQKQFTKGCLIGNLGQELSDQNECFRQKLDAIFLIWKQKFKACFEEAQKIGELNTDILPEAIADFFLASLEGAILRAKVTKSPEPLENFLKILFSKILTK